MQEPEAYNALNIDSEPTLKIVPVSSALPLEIFVRILLYLCDISGTRKQGLDAINLVCKRIRADYYIQQETYQFLFPGLEDRFAFVKAVSDVAIGRHAVFFNLIHVPVDGEVEALLHSRDNLHSLLEVHLCLSGYPKPFTNLFTPAFVPSCQKLALEFGDVEDIDLNSGHFHLCFRPLINLKFLYLSAFVHETEDSEWSEFWDINGLVLNKCMPCILGSDESHLCDRETLPSSLKLLIIKATFGWEFPCTLRRWIAGHFDFRYVPVFESERLNDLLELQELEDEWAVEDLDCFLLGEGVTAGSLQAAAQFWEHALMISNNRKKFLDSLNT